MTEIAAPHPLILASTSPYRRRLLARLGVPFQVAAPTCDEGGRDVPVRELPGVLARDKALSLRGTAPSAYILGSDQLVLFQGRALGKPGGREGARGQLRQLAGATHELITAVALSYPSGQLQLSESVYRMTMRSLRDDEIERYLDADAPFDCCGSYKIEARGIALFSSVVGDDVTAIEGLPLIATSSLLRSAGFHIP